MAVPEARLDASRPSAGSRAFAELLAIARYHIMLVAMAACLTFGWLMTGEHPFGLVFVVALDWFLINFMNRITDLEEDAHNGIVGTDRVRNNKRLFTIVSWVLLIGSLAALYPIYPALLGPRVAVQLIGLGYNYKIVPTPKGLSRFKEIYFFKNFGSSVLFVLTCFVYPYAAADGAVEMDLRTICLLAAFFVPFELTYEILYDLRDLDGDRREGVPTYPVVHGPVRARQIIDGLLLGSAAILACGLALGWIGLREGLMILAPLIQVLFYRPRLARGLTPRDCIVLTHLGTGLLVFYLVGTAVWDAAGLPGNIYLVEPAADAP